ncbi:RNA polymerase subunit sigma [Marinitenerispora sediminis]|uniref:RNA polymerase subunit sigma n=2 Tax=Marinitenerispora sediminis TaxID=1931232 RepID=A0A368T2I5_9ACTN|nr:RNA polymerase subunit sigma [Marinitenerispora sediminis]RCV51805.1 RNA polymerase subunit sigma [Marinitenerispora sediminis]RCV55423.1 RNA polymerase subunit sigma [Marinitenerispora sediminis]
MAFAARDGAEDAVEQLIRATRRQVAGYIARMADPQSVEELTQETYIRALRGLPRFAGRSSARVWLLSIARRTVVDRYRSLAARPRTTGVVDWDLVPARPARAATRFDEALVLRDLLNGLAEPRRSAFVLTQLDGFSYAEVARMTGVPVGTVRSRVARARADLIDALRLADRGTGDGAAAAPVSRARGYGGQRAK